MGMVHHFFSCRDVDIQNKHNIYIAFPLNSLLWGCKTWNLTSKNLKKLEAFHLGAARRILNIKFDQVREERIRNKQVRFKFCNIPNIKAFIICRTARYVGKITRSSEDNFPKRFLGAWIKKSKKTGGVQHSCNNNFAKDGKIS